MTWLFKGKKYLKVHDDKMIGFVYLITNNLSGKIYIGKKFLFHSRKTKIGKKEKQLSNTRKVFKTTIKESDWKEYYGSSLELKEDIKKFGKENFKREILEFSMSKKKLSYLEVKYMFLNNVLETDTYNGNILNRFFRKDLI